MPTTEDFLRDWRRVPKRPLENEHGAARDMPEWDQDARAGDAVAQVHNAGYRMIELWLGVPHEHTTPEDEQAMFNLFLELVHLKARLEDVAERLHYTHPNHVGAGG